MHQCIAAFCSWVLCLNDVDLKDLQINFSRRLLSGTPQYPFMDLDLSRSITMPITLWWMSPPEWITLLFSDVEILGHFHLVSLILKILIFSLFISYLISSWWGHYKFPLLLLSILYTQSQSDGLKSPGAHYCTYRARLLPRNTHLQRLS